MQIARMTDVLDNTGTARRLVRYGLGALFLAASLTSMAMAQDAPLVLQRNGRTISLEPYAPNILRVTISTDRAAATAAPGYGFVAKPSAQGWSSTRDAEGGEVFRSAKMLVHVAPDELPKDQRPQRMPLDALNNQLREKYFGGPHEGGPHDDALRVTTADGKTLLQMRTWMMTPERHAQAADPKDDRVGAMFDSPANEHYYGLGQQQKGWMDLRDHEIRCWHDYSAVGG